MRGRDFDELAFFQAIQRSGARALLIGRRALVLLGLPVLTADYDFWIAIDDIAAFNGAAAVVELSPSVEVQLPALDDLILTKRFASRPRDVEDIRLLTILKQESDT